MEKEIIALFIMDKNAKAVSKIVENLAIRLCVCYDKVVLFAGFRFVKNTPGEPCRGASWGKEKGHDGLRHGGPPASVRPFRVLYF